MPITAEPVCEHPFGLLLAFTELSAPLSHSCVLIHMNQGCGAPCASAAGFSTRLACVCLPSAIALSVFIGVAILKEAILPFAGFARVRCC